MSLKETVSVILLGLIFCDYLFKESEGLITQTRWCYVHENQQQGSWSAYNDSISSCVTCGGITRLYSNRNDPANEECCSGTFREDCFNCNTLLVTCLNGNKFCAATQACNNYNDCGDGSDEIQSPGICTTGCQAGFYTCNRSQEFPQCFDRTQVCDGVKDCFSGSDEINCLYYAGRCPGFLCTSLPQCVSAKAVCDGRKDCLDGSDEERCVAICGQTFKCDAIVRKRRSTSDTDDNQNLHNADPPSKARVRRQANCPAETISLEKVCNGEEDCIGGIDEDNCYTWASWSLWSSCDCAGSSLKGQNRRVRNCATHNDINTHYLGRCNGSQEDPGNCTCTPTTASTAVSMTSLSPFTSTPAPTQDVTILAVIILSSLIMVVVTAALIYVACSRREKARKKRKSQTTDGIESVYNSRRSQGGDSVFSGSSFANRTNFQPSPSPSILYRRSMHGSMPLLNGSVVHRNTLFPGSSIQGKASIPLPNRPGEEDHYERIAEPIIDPYAQTPVIRLPSRTQSTASISPRSSIATPYRERSSSFSSVNTVRTERDDASGILVRNYSFTLKTPQRERTISRVPISDLGPAPAAPTDLDVRSSNDTIDRDGYMLPIGRPGTAYTSMSSVSPERRSKYIISKTPGSMADRQRRKAGLNKTQRLTMQSHRYRRRSQPPKRGRLVSSKSVHMERTANFKKLKEDLSYHSDTYATMKGRVYNNDSDCSNASDLDSVILKRNMSRTSTASSHLAQRTIAKFSPRRHSADILGEVPLPPPDHALPKLHPRYKEAKPSLKRSQSSDMLNSPKREPPEIPRRTTLSYFRDGEIGDSNTKKRSKRIKKKTVVYTTVVPKSSRPTSLETTVEQKNTAPENASSSTKTEEPVYDITSPITSPVTQGGRLSEPKIGLEKPYDLLVREDVSSQWPIIDSPSPTSPPVTPKYLE